MATTNTAWNNKKKTNKPTNYRKEEKNRSLNIDSKESPLKVK